MTPLTIPLHSPLGKQLLLLSTVLALVVWEDLGIKGGVTVSESSHYSAWHSGHFGLLVAEKGGHCFIWGITPVTRKEHDLCYAAGAVAGGGRI